MPTVGMLYSTLHLKGIDVSLAALDQVKRQMGNLRVVAFGAEQVSRATAIAGLDGVSLSSAPERASATLRPVRRVAMR